MNDTIYAVSSGAPPAAIAILRLSGPDAFVAVERLAGIVPRPRIASLRALRDATGLVLDRALVLIFPGPDSVTGEDVAELHLHGGRAVVRAVETALGAMPALRPADPGEFTRRALAAGRLDLTEAEALGDLLAAETENQRRAAMIGAEGGLRRQVDAWTARTVMLAAAVEAAIDHSDEADAADEDALLMPARSGAMDLAREIAALVEQSPVERLHDGVRVVFAGPPNSGKSSLFNAMAGRDAAIVSSIAGTTRDRVEAPVTRGGTAWLLIDTAGLAETTDDPVEAIGIARSHDAIAAADIVLWLGDDPPPPKAIALHARADLPERRAAPPDRIAVSVTQPCGVQAVWAALDKAAVDVLPPVDRVALNRRQREQCRVAQESLCAAASERDIVLVAEQLRLALGAFDRLTGRAGTEDVLDALFGRFCIGK